MIWTFKNIALFYLPFVVLFGYIGISLDEPIAKGICITFILGILLCILFEANERMLKKID